MRSQTTRWLPPPARLRLGKDEVHIWRASLNQAAPVLQDLYRVLSADERERAEKYYFPRDRDRFVVARGALRTILGRYLGVEPARLLFCYNSYGKPALSAASGGPSLRFNVTHSQGLALYAFAFERELGIDVEYRREEIAFEQLAGQFFSPGEATLLRTLSADVRAEGFYRCWTRKEAYIKARGCGLSMPLDQFVVSFGPGEPAALLSVADHPGEVLRWSITDFTPGPDYAAAVAVEGHDWRPAYWQWEPEGGKSQTG